MNLFSNPCLAGGPGEMLVRIEVVLRAAEWTTCPDHAAHRPVAISRLDVYLPLSVVGREQNRGILAITNPAADSPAPLHLRRTARSLSRHHEPPSRRFPAILLEHLFYLMAFYGVWSALSRRITTDETPERCGRFVELRLTFRALPRHSAYEWAKSHARVRSKRERVCQRPRVRLQPSVFQVDRRPD